MQSKQNNINGDNVSDQAESQGGGGSVFGANGPSPGGTAGTVYQIQTTQQVLIV
jgi:hypothetical protein